jgi:hypothetical protein
MPGRRGDHHTREFVVGYSQGASSTIGIVSFAVFVGTAVLWIAQHTQHWPGGYLPWMISLGFALFAVSSLINARSFMLSRDRAVSELAIYLESTKYALQFLGISASGIQADPTNPLVVSPFQFCLNLKNVSAYPVQYQLMSASFTVGDSVCDRTPKEGMILLAGSDIWHTCDVFPSVSIEELNTNAFGEYVIAYGHPSRELQFEMRHEFHILPGQKDVTVIPIEWHWITADGPHYLDSK